MKIAAVHDAGPLWDGWAAGRMPTVLTRIPDVLTRIPDVLTRIPDVLTR